MAHHPCALRCKSARFAAGKREVPREIIQGKKRQLRALHFQRRQRSEMVQLHILRLPPGP
jgi:hypothetical protein